MDAFDAYKHCKAKGGKMVEIDSEEENTALVGEINRRGYTQMRMNFWIGLTDLGSEGNWWLSSSGLKPTYQNWHYGQPDNGRGYKEQDCARIRIGQDFDISRKDTWSDINCKSTHVTLQLSTYTTDVYGHLVPETYTTSMHALCEFSPTTFTEDSSIQGKHTHIY